MTDRHQAPSYPLRMPPELKERVAAAAKESGRSLHGELIARLQSSFEAPAAAPESLAAGLDKVLKELERLHDVNQQLLKLNTYPLDGSLDVSASDDPPTS